jgi:hypothetical protein
MHLSEPRNHELAPEGTSLTILVEAIDLGLQEDNYLDEPRILNARTSLRRGTGRIYAALRADDTGPNPLDQQFTAGRPKQQGCRRRRMIQSISRYYNR